MGSWSLAVYRAAAAALAPLAARRLAAAAGQDASLRAAQAERHGEVPWAGGELWIHAASVGEVNAAAPLVRALGQRFRLLHTSVTATGRQAIERHHGDAVRRLFLPLDTPGRVARWLDRSAPAGLILVETELWPELLNQCRARSIPVAMVSARLTERSRSRLRRVPGLSRRMLAGIDPVLCQSEADRARFAALGVAPERLAVAGNLKFDADPDPVVPAQVRAWAVHWAARPSWVAGSTHAAEEELLARAHRRVQERFANALLVLVPRHPERATDAMQRLQRAGLRVCRVDALAESPPVDAAVVDRLGVLAGLYRVTHAAVVGGSLAPGVGGHNLLEPALAERAVLAGRWTEAQQEAAVGLREAGVLFEVEDADELAGALIGLLDDPERAAVLGARARRWAQAQTGALRRTLEALRPWLAVLPPGRQSR